MIGIGVNRTKYINMERRKEVFIEVLRVLACMLVVLYHSRYEVYEYVNGGGVKYLLSITCA